jgi:hypothetical protein
MCLSLLDLVSKVNWKGKGGLGPCKTSTALQWEGNLFQVHLHALIAFLLLIEDFGDAMGFEAKNDRILVLDAKGGEIKGQTNKWISYHLRILKIVE